MHLSTLSITDVRQFEKRVFNFTPGFNLLIGENGSGKTTIFRGLLATLDHTRNIRSGLKLGVEDIRLGSERAEVEATVGFTDGRKTKFRYEKPLRGRVNRSPRGSPRPLILSYASNEAVCQSLKGKQLKRFGADKLANIRLEQEFLYFGSDGKHSNDQSDQNGKRFGSSQQVRDFIGKVFSTFSSEFEDFQWRFEPYDCTLILPEKAQGEMPIDAKLQDQVETAAIRFFQEGLLRKRSNFPIWPDKSEVILGREPQSSREEELNILLQDFWDGMDIPPGSSYMLRDSLLKVKLTPQIMIMRPIGLLSLSQLSDGEQRLFSLFVDIARELSIHEQFDDRMGSGKAIVLIDEIDVHLHPKWQRKIVPALEDLFPNCQFIATTHSPFVIQSVRSDSNLVLLDGQPLAQLGNTGIEEISQVVMDVDRPDVGERYANEVELAKSFLQLLNEAELAPEEKLQEYIYRLGQKLEHAENPAMQAFLELQQASRLEN